MSISRRHLLRSAAGGLAALPLPFACGSTGAPGETRDGDAAFLDAVRRGDVEAVRTALAARPALASVTDGEGRSAFVLASLAGHSEVARLLREQGLELDVVESVLAEDWERVEALALADPGCVNRAHPIGGTPLYAGGLAGSNELYRLRKLGCDPNGRPPGGSGFTPPRGSIECREPVGAFLATTDHLGNGSDANAEQRGGDSVLHGAVRRQDLRLVRLVVRKGGDVTARDERGRSPLALAEELEWEAGVALLRDHASIARDHRASWIAYDANRSPIEVPDLSDVPRAVQEDVTGSSHARFERVRELVSQDPRLVFSVSADNEIAVEACGHTGNREIMRYHLDHGAPLSLPTAVSVGDLEFVRWLLDGDPLLVNERGPHDFAPMWYPAIGGGGVEMAELLLERGTPVDQESLGVTGLHWAVLRKDGELVRWFVANGADVDAVGYKFDRNGQTPLALAHARGREEIARTLVELGARA